jgi:hypothetical protein
VTRNIVETNYADKWYYPENLGMMVTSPLLTGSVLFAVNNHLYKEASQLILIQTAIAIVLILAKGFKKINITYE